jgi:hypothetical protein
VRGRDWRGDSRIQLVEGRRQKGLTDNPRQY